MEPARPYYNTCARCLTKTYLLNGRCRKCRIERGERVSSWEVP
jgi:hypothetical protein